MTSKEYIEDKVKSGEKYIKKYPDCRDFIKSELEHYKQVLKDLEILEKHKKIEKKIGLSITTILKVLEEGIYKGKINVYGDYDRKFVIRFERKIGVDLIGKKFFEYSGITGLPNYPVNFKDYGKTWWLKEDKEKLNNLFNYGKDSIGDYWE